MPAFGCNVFFVREILSQRKASKWLLLLASVAAVTILCGRNLKKAIGICQIQSLFKHLMATTSQFLLVTSAHQKI